VKPRELGGILRSKKIKTIYTWVILNKYAGDWFEISAAFVRDIIDAAKDDNVEVIRAEVDGDELYIGGEDEIPAEATLVEPPEEEETEDLAAGETEVGEEDEDDEEEIDVEEEPE
jgi:hypothetical protein